MTDPVTDNKWQGAGIFQPLLHRVDLTGAPWHFDDWNPIWFAACRCPVTKFWGETSAGRDRCPACLRLEGAVPKPPAQRGRSHG